MWFLGWLRYIRRLFISKAAWSRSCDNIVEVLSGSKRDDFVELCNTSPPDTQRLSPISSTTGPLQCAQRVRVVHGNVWQWSAEAAASSPIQPISNLGTGFIEYNPPQFLITAHQSALHKVENNQYGPVSGMPQFKESLSQSYSPEYGRHIDPDSEIAVTTGATEGLLSSIMAFIEPGDEVILIEPVSNLYAHLVGLAGGVARHVPLHPPEEHKARTTCANDWYLNIQDLKNAITSRSRMLILNNPHNPLGKVYTKQELLAIGNLCVESCLVILSDEVYERIHFMPSFTHVASISDAIAANTMTVSSIGKLFNATGWRLGFVIGPPYLVEPVICAHILLSYTTAGPVQEAAAIGLREADSRGFWAQNLKAVTSKVVSFCEVLDQLRLPYVRPQGAYFVFVNIKAIVIAPNYPFPSSIAEKSRDYRVCWYLIHQHGVSSIPGSAFYCHKDAHLGEDFLRFGICKSDEALEMAKRRLREVKVDDLSVCDV